MRSLIVTVLLVTGTAHAEKSRETAQAAAGVGAGVSSALVVSAFFVGTSEGNDVNFPLLYVGLGSSLVTPSLGQLYAGEYLTPGMGVRALAAGLAFYAAKHGQQTVTCDYAMTIDQKCKSWTENAIVMFGLAGIAYIGGVAWDVMDAGDAVDRYNARHRYTVTPTALAGPRGLAPGLYFSATY